jgi:hypothetical protein
MMTLTRDPALLDSLWSAASTGDSATIRVLALKGVDLDARDGNNFTAYHLARLHNHASTAKAIQAAREYQYLRKIGIELERIGNLNPAARKHYNA